MVEEISWIFIFALLWFGVGMSLSCKATTSCLELLKFILQEYLAKVNGLNHTSLLFGAGCTVLGLELGKECVVVGTLYKHMKLKPSILDEYSKEVCVSLLIDCTGLRVILHLDVFLNV